MSVVSNASPLHYLVLIQREFILPRLYTQVLIPEEVLKELRHSSAPHPVRTWALALPAWVEVKPNARVGDPRLEDLDAGEREVVLLAHRVRSKVALLDEKDGRRAASEFGIMPTGTIGILYQGAKRGLIDLAEALQDLRRTNFYASSELWALSERLVQELEREKPRESSGPDR